MLVICAIGQRGGPELIRRLTKIMGNKAEYLLLHVIDTGLRHHLEDYLRGPLHRLPHHGKPAREEAIKAAEETAGKKTIEETLDAARNIGLNVSSSIKQGRPEEIIVQFARERQADLIVIWAHEGAVGRAPIGPASIGHTTRFVLDHAGCDVLLLREKDI
jgi:nucleotide-binding universal stress UspA family protein